MKGNNTTNPLVLARKMKKYYSMINLLFLSGYNEKPIFYAK